jgi:hypothetical protein
VRGQVRVPLRVTVASKANADGIVEEANAPSAGEPTVVVTFVCMTYAFGGVETITKRFDMKGSTCVPPRDPTGPHPST